MGEVYLAFDPSLSRHVAVKRLPERLSRDPDRLERFRQEARLLASVNHPNIATIYSFEESDGVSFLTMEAIDGVTLRDRIADGRLPVRETLEVGRQIARALETAHRRGIVHRDLKPGNVMLSSDQSVKVLDFGLAVSASARIAPDARAGRATAIDVAGTPGYMSPEQLQGGAVDPRWDVFAFGAVLFECLTGRPAFAGEASESIVRETMTGHLDFERLPAETPPKLRELIATCLGPTMARRYASMVEPRLALENLLTETAFAPSDASKTGGSPVTHNLPRFSSSFVGRASERVEILALLGTHRLVSLTGVGGVGKTRLALEVAREGLEASDRAVWFVDLTSVPGDGDVAAAVIQTLGLPQRLDQPAADTLSAHASRHAMLLILDNCEHVIEGAAALAHALLRRSEHTRILATSRERLGVEGEAVYPVPLLDSPGAREVTNAENLARWPAVELLLARARQAGSDLVLDASNAETIAAICRRLDGIPLAIELAAARLRALPPAEFLRRLDDRFRLLTSGGRGGVAHHRTLRALIDWSYEHLEEPERVLLDRLSIFAGGFTLEAAEEVGAGDPVPDWDVLDVLTRLVDKSLVEPTRSGGALVRFRLLETVHAYASERLDASGERARMTERHRAFYVDLATKAEIALLGPQQLAWITRLAGEYDNLRRALDSALEPGVEPKAALRIAASLYRFWMIRGHWNDAEAYATRALAHGGPIEGADAAKVLNVIATTALFRGNLALADELWTRLLDIWTRLEVPTGIAAINMNLGNVAQATGEYEKAEERFKGSLEVALVTGQVDTICRSLISLSNVSLIRQNYAAARSYAEQAIQRLEGLGHAELNAHALNTLGTAELRLRDLDAARAAFERSLAIQDELRDERNTAISKMNLGVVYHEQCRLDEATSLYKAALRAFHGLDEGATVASALEGLATMAVDRGHDDHALVAYGAADAIRSVVGNPRMPDEETVVQKLRDGIRARVGEEAFRRFTQTGNEMSMDAAVRWAQETIA